MTLTVTLFASLADRAGERSLRLRVPEGVTAGELWSAALEAYPVLAGGPRPLVAVNLEYAAPDQPLREGDEVAFLPPVSGG